MGSQEEQHLIQSRSDSETAIDKPRSRSRRFLIAIIAVMMLGMVPVVLTVLMHSKSSHAAERPALIDVKDVNLLILTDVHSWMNGNAHNENITAKYADVLSLAQRLNATLKEQQKSFFFVNNGDLNDGTGLSGPVMPNLKNVLPIVERMPFDAINCGNHELYKNENVEYLVNSGFVERTNGRYLTSNIRYKPTNNRIGQPYRQLRLKQGGHATVFGFLYNMTDNENISVVEPVQSAVQDAWFAESLSSQSDDPLRAVIVLAHMGYDNTLVDLLLAAIRSHVPVNLPIVFVTGHTHLRRWRPLDPFAFTLEAGKYMDTVGFVSFNLPHGDDNTLNYFNISMTPNITAFAAMVNTTITKLPTPDGIGLQREIDQAYARLGLSQRLGCAPQTYKLYASLDDPASLNGLYLEEVLPITVFKTLNVSAPYALHGSGSFRTDLYQGNVTLNDLYTMSPFGDEYFYSQTTFNRTAVAALTAKLPHYIHTDLPDADDITLVTMHYHLSDMTADVQNVTGSTPKWQIIQDYNASSIWKAYTLARWRCS